jgi:hypothetical protein
MATKFEYKAWFVTDDINKVNELMAQWAEAGWELVSGGMTTYSTGASHQTVHFQYTQYWRRAIYG